MADQPPRSEETILKPAAVAIGPTFVRVLGTRHDQYVEFEFAVGDRDLAIELIMPFAAFEEFCATHRCAVAAADGAAQAALEKLAGRADKARP